MFAHWIGQPETLPPSYREQIETGSTPARIVCDYIAGMTDNFISHLHHATFGRLSV
jgi:dGTPase